MSTYNPHDYAAAKYAYDKWIKTYSLSTEDLPGEVWRPVPDFDNYHGSNLGRAKRVYKNGKVIILKPFIDQKGYLEVMLSKNGKAKHFKLHRLIATLFLPNPFNLPEVDHINGDKFDVRVTNLEWTTSKENQRRRGAKQRHSTRKKIKRITYD